MNIITLAGRLIADPELKTTSNGKQVASFCVAVKKQRPPTDGGKDSDFFSCRAWGKDAEYVTNYGAKGRQIMVSGTMESREYKEKTYWDISASRVAFLDRGVQDDKPKAKQAALDEYDPFADE